MQDTDATNTVQKLDAASAVEVTLVDIDKRSVGTLSREQAARAAYAAGDADASRKTHDTLPMISSSAAEKHGKVRMAS